MRMSKIMPALALGIGLSCGATVLALADSAGKSPILQATEAKLIEELTEARDWQGKAIELQAQVTQQNVQIMTLQKELEAAKATVATAASKAAIQPPPAAPQQP